MSTGPTEGWTYGRTLLPDLDWQQFPPLFDAKKRNNAQMAATQFNGDERFPHNCVLN